MKQGNLIQEKSFQFALQIIEVYKLLVKQNGVVISRQLLKSGTSIGANVEESLAAQSKKDFVHKMSIASKEARETKYWLRLLDASQLVKIDYAQFYDKIDTICNVLTKIVKTSSFRLSL